MTTFLAVTAPRLAAIVTFTLICFLRLRSFRPFLVSLTRTLPFLPARTLKDEPPSLTLRRRAVDTVALTRRDRAVGATARAVARLLGHAEDPPGGRSGGARELLAPDGWGIDLRRTVPSAGR